MNVYIVTFVDGARVVIVATTATYAERAATEAYAPINLSPSEPEVAEVGRLGEYQPGLTGAGFFGVLAIQSPIR